MVLTLANATTTALVPELEFMSPGKWSHDCQTTGSRHRVPLRTMLIKSGHLLVTHLLKPSWCVFLL